MSAAQAGTCLERFGDIDALQAPALPPLEDLLTQQGAATHSTSAEITATTASGTPFAIAAVSSPAKAGPIGQQGLSSSFSRSGSASERIVNEAVCLATPPDNPAENNSPLRQPQPASSARPAATASRPSSSTGEQGAGAGSTLSERLSTARTTARLRSSMGLEAAEELLQLEGAAATYSQYAAMMHANEVLQASAAVRRQRRRALIKLLRKTRQDTAAGLSALQDSAPGQLLASISASIGTLGSWDDEGAGAASSPPRSSSPSSCVSDSSSCAGRNRGGSSKRAASRRSGYSSSGSDDTDVEWEAAAGNHRLDD